MALIRKNLYLTFFFSLILLLSFSHLVLLQKEERQMSQIHIEKGDTLWTMAESFSGDTPHQEWIKEIMDENGLSTPHLIAGQTIKIPREDLKFAPDDTIQLAGDSE
ncbi:LysM peptidoglycan-binding domain-containing protein [Planococcus salinus]|uniref:LysM peptidoglycan-binding domain-containing protein n=2 Tax=Planococcus salinus TaxID=1848460 RepID=A0A3M8PA17_9BACL|nr:LysM peptidoglycan-binding domain-containing protein [Planococcus salinus]